MKKISSRLHEFGVSADRGFLPERDPLQKLPRGLRALEELAHDMPDLLAARAFGHVARIQFPVLDVSSELTAHWERECAFMRYAFCAHAYLFEHWQDGDVGVRTSLPPSIAIPLVSLAQSLGRPPVLSYASYALYNWRRFDPREAVSLGNIALLQSFLGGLDEKWFILPHVEIEAHAGRAVDSAVRAQEAALRRDGEVVYRELVELIHALTAMCCVLDCVEERCDPYIYFNRVRPFIHGSKDHPAFEKVGGVVYEGVHEFRGKPQKFRGETGAQSTIIPVLDAALGVQHEENKLTTYLMEMRDYMPLLHRRFLEEVEKVKSVRSNAHIHSEIRDVFNECISLLARFRRKHFEYAATYIHGQALKGKNAANPSDIGTGGTPFMEYLRKHLEETNAAKI